MSELLAPAAGFAPLQRIFQGIADANERSFATKRAERASIKPKPAVPMLATTFWSTDPPVSRHFNCPARVQRTIQCNF
jgi:hypothetical protein